MHLRRDSNRFGRFGASSLIAVFCGISLSATGCKKQSTVEPAEAPPPPPAAAAPVAMAPEGQPAPAGQPQQQQPQMPAPVVVKEGLKAPESVLYVPEEDVYLVSNVNGSPLDTDNNGFISKVAPDGKILELKWIESGKKGVTLNAPKGMGISKGNLYVADITFVRIFDAKTGAPKGKLGIPSATFLNDVAIAPDGTIYVSDSGLKAGKEGFEPTGTDSIYKIGSRAVPEKVIVDKQLGRPNGLLADAEGVWVVTNGSNQLLRIGKDGKIAEKRTELPNGSLDGIVKLADGTVLISSWKASTIYKGTPGGDFKPLIEQVNSPADIGLDTKRNALLIPLMQSDTLQIQQLIPATAQTASATTQVATAQQKPAAAAPAGAGAAPKQPAAAAAAPKQPAAAPPKQQAAAPPAAAPKPAAPPAAQAAATEKKAPQTAQAEEKAAAPAAPAPAKK